MLTSAQLKKIVAEARPLIEQQLDLTEQVAGLRDVVTAAGGDWSQLKALVKAQIQDERDEAGDGKRVRKILDKADYAASYADMLGLANMNEKNSFADGDTDPAFDRWLEEVADRVDPALLIQIIEGSKSAAGRAIIMASIQVVKDDRLKSEPLPDHDPETGEITETDIPVSTVPRHEVEEADEGEVTPPASSADIQAETPTKSTAQGKVGHGDQSDPTNAARVRYARQPLESEAGRPRPATLQSEASSREVPPPADTLVPVDTNSEPASPPSEIAVADDRGAVVPSASPVVEPFVAEYAEPGVVVVERCPPEGIVAHPFAACWPVNSIDVSKGVREPVVKIGKLILDGRGRYFAARDAGIEYPVVQYDGTDPLLDCIRWNLASRPKLSEGQRRLIAQKLTKVEPGRADEVMQLFQLHLEAAE